MNNEIEWKPVIGYEGLYEVSNMGDVRSLRRNSTVGLVLAKFVDRGYVRYNLSIEGKTKSFTGHKIVANAFMPKVEGKKYINHKNGIRNDNRVENLEWCTQAENQWHKVHVLGSTGKGNKAAFYKRGKGNLYATPNVTYALSQFGIYTWALRVDLLIVGMPNYIGTSKFIIEKEGDNWVSGYKEQDNWVYRKSGSSLMKSVSVLILYLLQTNVIDPSQVNNQLK